nr:sulfotransferase [uncultured Undibacterium sp.]
MTHPKFHFITGLPRSGSTLLSAILLQNPRFHASMTSPIGTLMTGMINQLGAGSEFGGVVSTEQRQRLATGMFHSYYSDKADKDVIFDTNRMWSAHMPLLLKQFPEAKFIACVRNVAWIMDSLERRYRENPYETTRLFGNAEERSTVYNRVETLSKGNRMVGYPWTALKEAFYGENSNSLLILDYDLLAQVPDKIMPLIYQFLGEPEFKHDFEHLEYDAPEFDAPLGIHGMHKIRPKVGFQKRASILPPDIFERFSKMSFWNDRTNSRCSVIAAQPIVPEQAQANAPEK